jgi:hypothetical protein
MSNALSKIDSQTVARTDPEVTDIEAQAAAKNCGIPIDSLLRVASKKEVGKYLSREIHGTIIADAYMDRVVLDELQKEMMKIVQVEGVDMGGVSAEIASAIYEHRISAAQVITKIVEKKSEIATLQLKAAEIGGHSKKKRSMESVGPPIDA